MSGTTEGNHYTLQIASSGTSSFTVQAVAIGSLPQANDSGCTTHHDALRYRSKISDRMLEKVAPL